MSTVLSFLELPAEIRNQIYSYVAADEGSCQVNPISIDIVIWSGSGLRNYDSKVITLTRNGAKLKHGLAALLRVNKTLREECLAFVLDQNVIIAGHDSSIEDLINALGKPSRHLRRLILPHQPGLTYPLSRGARITALLQNCRSIQAQLPKLERLDISIVTTHAGDKCIVEWARQHRSPTPPSLESRSVVRQCTAAEHISMASNEPLTEDFHMLARSILEQGVKTHDHRTLNLRAEEEIIDGQKHKVWKGIFSAVVCGSLACVAWDELKVMIVETQIRR